MVGRRLRCPGSGPAGAFTTVALPTGGLRVAEFIELKSRRPKRSRHNCEAKVVTLLLAVAVGGSKPSNGAGSRGLRSKVVTVSLMG